MALTAPQDAAVVTTANRLLARIPNRLLAESEAQRRRDEKDRQHLHQVGQRGRVFKRMR